ncbi:MAG: response regulator [Anaerolineales bacterium]|nr:response regulator [Anaerolineales bacterium]
MSASQTIRVQIADDHDVVVQGVTSILEAEADIEVVGPTISSGDELIENVREATPNVLLLDVKMPDFDMLTTLGRLTALMPRLRTIIVTAQQDPQLVKAAADKGAAGYILKEEALSSLLPLAIRGVAKGELWFSPRSTQHLIGGYTDELDLSEYRRDVLRLMVHGKTPQEIAHSLQRSVSAIYSAQTLIREKLGVDTNEQAIVVAIRDRLVPLSFD